MFQTDKVSIIIPCFNYGHYLADAINSAIAQTHKNIEIIVVNDGSTDNTSAVALQYENVVLIEQENRGVSAARNAGIRQSTGGWIICLDADDKLHPQYIERTIGLADIVGTKLETFGTEKEVWIIDNPDPVHDDFLQHNHTHCASIFKKQVWENTGGYDESRLLSGYADWDFWIAATGAGFKVIIIDEVLFFYRKHGHSMYSNSLANHENIMQYLKEKYQGNRFR